MFSRCPWKNANLCQKGFVKDLDTIFVYVVDAYASIKLVVVFFIYPTHLFIMGTLKFMMKTFHQEL